MTADLIGWHDEHAPDHRRRLRNAMFVSVAVHGSIFAAFAIAPPRAVVPMPQVLAVELVSLSPPGARSSRPRPAPTPAPPPAETAAPEPPAPPPPAPPVAKAPVQVLPEESPGRIRKVEPEAAKPKVAPQTPPKPVVRRPRKEEALSYDDAMAELGLAETEEFLEAVPGAREEEASSGEAQATDGAEEPRAGVAISPELAKWHLDTKRRIQSKWVTPSNFRGRGLATRLELRLSASGDVIGTPEVAGSSGDPYFDDNAVRAVLTAAPLPPPPKPGRQSFIFRSEAN